MHAQGEEAIQKETRLFCSLYKGLVINYGERGGYKMGKSRVRNFLCPPSKQGKTFRAPPFKEWKLFAPPL